jgi:hypothetical protein
LVWREYVITTKRAPLVEKYEKLLDNQAGQAWFLPSEKLDIQL